MSVSIVTIYSFLLHSDIMETSQKGNGMTSQKKRNQTKKFSKNSVNSSEEPLPPSFWLEEASLSAVSSEHPVPLMTLVTSHELYLPLREVKHLIAQHSILTSIYSLALT